MKKPVLNCIIASLACFSMVLMGCPVNSDYPLVEKKNAIALSTPLEGTWINQSEDAEMKTATIAKEGDNTYDVKVGDKKDTYMADTDHFKAWGGSFAGKTFLILQEVGDDGPKEKYFLYNLTLNGKNSVFVEDVGLKVNGRDAIKSVKTYQEEVKASMGHEDYLSGKMEWRKN